MAKKKTKKADPKLKNPVSGIPAGSVGSVRGKNVVFQHPANERRKLIVGGKYKSKFTEQ